MKEKPYTETQKALVRGILRHRPSWDAVKLSQQPCLMLNHILSTVKEADRMSHRYEVACRTARVKSTEHDDA